MVAISLKSLGRAEIAEVLGHRSVSGAAKKALADLIEFGMVEYTIPDELNSRLQKYHLTEKGRNLLDSLDGRNDK